MEASGLGCWVCITTKVLTMTVGAVAISFVAQKQQTQALVCLCSAHLGPHEGFKNFEWRNTESDHILSQMAVGNRLLIEHPTLFLFGDLNYRMHDCKRDDILGWIQDKQIDMLLQRDELKALEKSKHLLSRFMEPKITFLPTYKLDSKREYSKKRLPAYCDRILYNSESVQPMSYDRVPFSLSDHDPVIAMFMFEPQEPNKASQVSSWIQRRLLFILRVNQFRILFLLLLWLGSVFFSRN
ncbi:Endonuclease/exonuclease/phosphatase [Gorgonomyces haynaldii]|nr:Endonuclease/exonuclease/phosphatase [Gorgonomyces haynaldii]